MWLQRHLLKRVSPAEYSLYPVLVSIMVFVYMAKTVFTSGVSRFVTEAYALDDNKGITSITSSMFMVTVSLALLILAAGSIAAWHVDALLDIGPGLLGKARLMMLLMAASTSFQLAITPFETGLYARQRFVHINIVAVGVVATRIILLFVLLFGIGPSVLWVSVATEASAVLGVIARACLSHRCLPSMTFRFGAVSRSVIRRVGAFGSWTLVNQAAYRIMTSVGPLVLHRLASPLDVAVFYLGSLASHHLSIMVQTVAHPLIPALTALHAVGDHRRLHAAYLRYGRYYSWAFLCVAVPVVVFRKEIMLLYVGREYLPAATVMLLLLLESPLNLPNTMLHGLAVAQGRIKALAIRGIAVQLVNIACTLYFVGLFRMGAVGAALSAFIVYNLSTIVLEIPLGLSMSRISLGEWVKEAAFPGLLPGLVTAVLLSTLRYLRVPQSWLELGLYFCLSGSLYLWVTFLFCLRGGDRRDLSRIFSKVQQHLPAVAYLFGQKSA
ncbi:MAG: hypothetical protein GF331_24545 [Chitinivibrionales bacterium]|nr:hypothetical protein [Chitinivibrionales bacterium]